MKVKTRIDNFHRNNYMQMTFCDISKETSTDDNRTVSTISIVYQHNYLYNEADLYKLICDLTVYTNITSLVTSGV